MQVKLIAYSIIEIAPPGYQTPYGVGMAEDANGTRYLVRIRQDYLKMLKTGLNGEVTKEKVDGEELDFFKASE